VQATFLVVHVYIYIYIYVYVYIYIYVYVYIYAPGYDRGDTVQATFLVVGAVLVLWAALIFSCLRNEPPPHPAHPAHPAYPAHQGPSVQAMRGGGKEKSSPFSSPAAAADVKVPLLEDDCQV